MNQKDTVATEQTDTSGYYKIIEDIVYKATHYMWKQISDTLGDDVQGRILLILIIWLFINLIVLKIVWNIHGSKICDLSLRQGFSLADDKESKSQ